MFRDFVRLKTRSWFTRAAYVSEWQLSDVIASYYLFLTTFLRTPLHTLGETHGRSGRENKAHFRFDLWLEENME
jgi:hypothetical protein